MQIAYQNFFFIFKKLFQCCCISCAFNLIFLVLYCVLFILGSCCIFFYVFSFSPSTYINYPIYFEYDGSRLTNVPYNTSDSRVPIQNDIYPVAKIPISNSWFVKQNKSPVRVKQIFIDLNFPNNDKVVNKEKFMIEFNLLNDEGESIFQSRRPFIFQYKPTLIHYLESFLETIPTLLGYHTFSSSKRIPMLVETDQQELLYINKKFLEATMMSIELSESIPVYESSIHITGEMIGWTYFVYVHWMTALVILHVLFFLILCGSLGSCFCLSSTCCIKNIVLPKMDSHQQDISHSTNRSLHAKSNATSEIIDNIKEPMTPPLNKHGEENSESDEDTDDSSVGTPLAKTPNSIKSTKKSKSKRNPKRTHSTQSNFEEEGDVNIRKRKE